MMATRSKKSENNKNAYSKDEKYAEEKIIEKIQKKGFESLSIEELAMTMINPSFEENFKKKTGKEWTKENKSKAKERLSQAKFNIQWNTSMNKKSTSAMLKSPLGVLIDLTEKGDLQKIIEYFKKNNQYLSEMQNLVDVNKKSLLHIASKSGHPDIIQFLISKNFSVFSRDKFLRTPLHLACQFGRLNCFKELLKGKSDILSKDSIGRNCLHYASCSNNSEIVNIILKKAPELINDIDIYGRTPLHYSIWNATNAQLDIINSLIKNKCNVNCFDEEKMTPLHFACDAGKGKVIKLLLENGANPFLKDKRTNRNCLEIAANEKIRDIIVMYCSEEFKDEMNKIKIKGVNNLDNGNIENQEIEDKNKIIENKNETNENIKLKSNQKKLKEEFEDDETINKLLQKQNKGKLVNFMGDIQSYGVKTMQHLTKPEIYSGSWLERIHNIDDLYNFLKRLSPQESAIAIYNVLSPYSKTLPQGNGDEPNMAFFFNKNVKKNIGFISQNNLQMSIEGNYNNFDSENNENNNINFNQQRTEINALKEQIKELNKKFEDEKNSNQQSEEILKLKVELNNYLNENEALKEKSTNLKEQIKNLTENVKLYENKTLQLQTNESIQKDKLINNLTAQLSELNNQMEEIKTENKRGIPNYKNNNSSSQFKSINPKLYPALSNNINLSLEDESKIYTFNKLCEKNGGLLNALQLYDQDNDMHLLKNEFESILDYLQIPFEIRDSIIKVSGFENNNKLSINKIYNSFNKRNENKIKKLNQCLYNIIYKLSDDGITVEDLYKELSTRCKDNKISYEDFIDITCEKFYINEDDAKGIFENWDFKDKNEIPCIDIDELIKLLNERKNVIDQISDLTNKIKFNLNKKNKIQNKISENQQKNEEKEFNGEDTFKSNKRFTNFSYKNSNDEEYISKNTIKIKQDDEEENYEYDNQEEIEEEKKIEEEEENSNESKNSKNKTLNRKITVSSSIPEITNIGEKVGDFLKSSLKKNEINNEDNVSENSSNKSIKNNKDIQASLSNEDNESQNLIIQKPQSSFSSKFKINTNKNIYGELKVQVKNAEKIILPKSIVPPYSFSLKFSINGINKVNNSKEIISDDLNEINFNWATRCLLKKKTLNDISSYCTITLFLNNNNNIIELGKCSFDWTCTLNKKCYDKYEVDDNFQILNEQNFQIGNIRVQAKFIPFGIKNSNFDNKGKRKKNPTNLNGLVKEESFSSIASSKKSLQQYPSIQSSQLSEKEISFHKNENEHNEDNKYDENNNEENNDNYEELKKEDEEYKNEEEEENKNEENEESKKEENENNEEELNNNEEEENKNEEEENKNEEEENKNEEEENKNEEEENKNEEEEYKNNEEEEYKNNEEEENKNNEEEENKNEEEEYKNNEEEENKNEEEEYKNNEEENNEENDEVTILKEIDGEIINIVDKDKLKDKNIYFSIISNSEEPIEVYSTKEEKKLNDIIVNLPFTFKFNIYSTSKAEKIPIEIVFKNENDDSIYSKVNIEFNAQEDNLTVTDQYILNGQDEIKIFMKFTINTIEDI